MATQLPDSLSVTNALIGLTKSDGQWPNVLGQLGYRVYYLERTLVTAKGDYCADVILRSASENHALVCEVKCGNNVVARQHAAILAVDVDCLRDAGLHSDDWDAFRMDCSYWSTDDFCERLRIGLAQFGSLPLVVLDDDRIALVDGSLRCDACGSMLLKGIQVDGLNPPRGYVPFDRDSTELHVAHELLPVVFACLRRGDQWLTLDEFISRCHPLWGKVGQAARAGVVKTVRQVLKKAELGQLADFIALRLHEQPPQIHFLKEMSTLKPAELRQGIVRFDAASRGLLESLGQSADAQLTFDGIV